MAPDDALLSIPIGGPSPAAIYAPSPVYLTGEEWLRVTSFANTAGIVLGVTGRIFRPDNVPVPIAESHTPNSNRTVNQTRHPLSEGWLLGLDVLATAGAPLFGQVWVCLELVRGGTANAQVVQALAMGFPTTRTPLVWPGGANVLPLDGPANLRAITGTAPGAGNEVSETVPAGARWQLLNFHALFNTSAVVANRAPALRIDDGANIYFGSPTIVAQVASTGLRYCWFPGAVPTTILLTPFAPLPLTIVNFLPAGHRIRTQTANLDPGDTWTGVQYLVREWLTGE